MADRGRQGRAVSVRPFALSSRRGRGAVRLRIGPPGHPPPEEGRGIEGHRDDPLPRGPFSLPPPAAGGGGVGDGGGRARAGILGGPAGPIERRRSGLAPILQYPPPTETVLPAPPDRPADR